MTGRTLRDVVIISAVVLVLYFFGLGVMQLKQEEPRRALIAREMIASGHWFVPRLCGEPYLAKPPVFNWLIALCSFPGGAVTETAARVPSALSVLGIALLLYWMAGSIIGGRTGLWAGLMTATSALFLEKGPMAEIDVNFAFWVMVSVCFLFRAWNGSSKLDWPASYFFLAVAFLTKGPPALLFFAAGVIALAAIDRSFKPFLTARNGLGFAFFLAPIAVWLWAVHREVGIPALLATSRTELGGRALGMSLLNPLELLFYPLRLLAGGLPWSLLALLAFDVFTGDRGGARVRLVRFSLLFSLISIALFSLSAGKAARYILPAVPFLALAAADVFDRLLTRELTAGKEKLARRCLMGLSALMGIAMIVLIFIAVQDWEVSILAAIRFPLLGLVAAIAGVIATGKRRYAAAFAAIVLIVCVYRVNHVVYYLPHSNAEKSVADTIEAIQVRAGEDALIYNLHRPPSWLVLFYLDRTVRNVDSAAFIASQAAGGADVHCLVYADEAAELETMQPDTWRSVVPFRAHDEEMFFLSTVAGPGSEGDPGDYPPEMGE